MDQAIKLVGESDEAELKDLLGKAEGIEAPPQISRTEHQKQSVPRIDQCRT